MALPLRVLVIEDDDALASMLLQILRHDGCFVTHAHDGAEGVSAFEKERPHVVLIDALLPKSNGFDVCKRIRAIAGDTVGLLLMSASFRHARGNKAIEECGADDFIAKPFVLADLRRRIKELGERSTAVRKQTSSSPVAKSGAGAKSGAAHDVSWKKLRFTGAHEVARALLAVARAGGSGVVHVDTGGAALDLAFLKGVLVGGLDDGSAIFRPARALAEGKIDSRDALSALGSQVRAWVAAALKQRVGTLAWNDDEAAAHRMAIDVFHVQREIMAHGLLSTDGGPFLFTRGGEALERTVDFDEGLVHYASLRPTSTLPAALLAGAPTLVDAALAAKDDTADLYALWLAGMIRLAGDPPADARALPRALLPEAGAFVDVESAARIADVLVTMRGKDFYAALGVSAKASSTEIGARLDTLERRVGIEVLGTAQLGPLRVAARELWTLFDEIRATLLDDDATRRAYDAEIGAVGDGVG